MSDETRYIVYDTESVVDTGLLSRSRYPGEELSADEAVGRYLEERGDPDAFVPVTYHVPVAIAVARVSADFRLIDASCLDAPAYDPEKMVRLFWKGVAHYGDAVLVDFNGRGFDLPLLTLAAFRWGISAPRYFNDPDRYGFRYRFTSKHIDLQEWVTEYGGFRLVGGLNLLAKILGAPGKMDTSGGQVGDLHREGRIDAINDYCLHDVLDTYLVFLRTRVLAGCISPEEERALHAETRRWIESRLDERPALGQYLANWREPDPS